ncbi:3-oxoadipyl-CoA thiolase [Orbus sturtevantii]|uniref:3-oxoadipyl-CoA thiolase n=1 Tax=Orbus sturtevantii TaxID=3074109 RepID=UPI00370D6B25
MYQAYICEAVRTPIGRYGGGLSSIRTDDLASIPLKILRERCVKVDWDALDDVILGCTNQSGEDNRNVARMASLLAGLPTKAGGATVNRLCGSGMQAVGDAARLINVGMAELVMAGGVESMSRSPFVIAKSTSAFSRDITLHDSTIGWRFVNPKMVELYGIDGMPETAQNVANQFGISREAQDIFSLNSQHKVAKAQENGVLAQEICPVSIPQRKGEPITIDKDEHPRLTSLEALSKLKSITGPSGSITAGNSSGVNDGACALVIANEKMALKQGLTPRARIVGSLSVGVEPKIMGIGPVPATQKLLQKLNLTIDDMDVIELNEAFAAQGLACLHQLGITDNDERVNPNGGAIALGHPLGMSGARIVTTAMYQLQRTNGRYALCTMCIGVGQGIAMVLERI